MAALLRCVELDELGLGADKADLQACGLAEPAFLPSLCGAPSYAVFTS
jgi:hypothetical protein